MSTIEREVSEGIPTESRIFEPPQANRDNEKPRYLSFIGSLVDPEIIRSRPWTKGGGIEISNPCLRYVKNFLRKGRITPLLKDTHDFMPVSYIAAMVGGNPLNSGYFAQPIPPGYVPPMLPPAAGEHHHGFGSLSVGGPSPYGSLVGRIALPGEQIDAILTGAENLTQTNIQRGVVEHKSLAGHEYRPQQIGEVYVDPEVWQMQQAIFPTYPNLPILLDDIERLLEAAEVHTLLRPVIDEMAESLILFRDYADATIQNVHHNIRESAGRRGYVYRYTSMDLVLLEQLGKQREDREIRQQVQSGDADIKELLRRQAEVQTAWMQAQIEEKQALAELHKRQAALLGQPPIDETTMMAAPVEVAPDAEGFPGASGYSGFSGAIAADAIEHEVVASSDEPAEPFNPVIPTEIDLHGERPASIHHKTWEKMRRDAGIVKG